MQEIPENGADVNHLSIVHTPIYLAGPTPANSWLSPWLIKHVWAGKWSPCEEYGEKHVAVLNLEHGVKLFNLTLPFVTVKVRAVQVSCD